MGKPRRTPKSSVELGSGQAVKNAKNLTSRQATSIAKTAIKQQGKTARQIQSGKTRRAAVRSGAVASSAESTASADASARQAEAMASKDTRSEWRDKTGDYDGLTMGGLGPTDDGDQVMKEEEATDVGPGKTKVWT